MKNLFRLGLQFFGEGENNDTQNNGTDAQNNGDQNQNNNSGEQKKEFSTAELQAMMTKEKNEGRAAVLRELGITDVKDAKKSLEDYKKYLDSQKTELQKAQDDNKVLNDRASKAEQKSDLLEKKFSALELGVKMDCVDDVIALASTKTTDEKDFKTVVGELKTKYPTFFGESSNGGTGTGTQSKNNTNSTNTSNWGARLATSTHPTTQKSSYFKN